MLFGTAENDQIEIVDAGALEPLLKQSASPSKRVARLSAAVLVRFFCCFFCLSSVLMESKGAFMSSRRTSVVSVPHGRFPIVVCCL